MVKWAGCYLAEDLVRPRKGGKMTGWENAPLSPDGLGAAGIDWCITRQYKTSRKFQSTPAVNEFINEATLWKWCLIPNVTACQFHRMLSLCCCANYSGKTDITQREVFEWQLNKTTLSSRHQLRLYPSPTAFFVELCGGCTVFHNISFLLICDKCLCYLFV